MTAAKQRMRGEGEQHALDRVQALPDGALARGADRVGEESIFENAVRCCSRICASSSPGSAT
ncbi:hypothetical protein ACWCRF_14360 [Streptomyces sp. NPDC002405]|uniref:hypothetical protein n=1 Tax=unclassified Streptomyces TaxID=2593676 RepID=UPI0036AA10FB